MEYHGGQDWNLEAIPKARLNYSRYVLTVIDDDEDDFSTKGPFVALSGSLWRCPG
jgi:hypothetical protein